MGNISRTLIVIFGIAIGGFIFVYSFVCADSMQSYVDKSETYILGLLNLLNIEK